MKTAGIVGGLGPESTIDYYRAILAAYRRRVPDGSAPPLLIKSVDMQKMVRLVESGRLDALAAVLTDEIRSLARGGAAFAAISANTPHLVFDAIQRESPIPLISIVEASRDAAAQRSIRRAALLDTRFTMRARFFQDVFAGAGIVLVVPDPGEQEYLHGIYMNELVNGRFESSTRAAVLRIVDRLCAGDKVDGVILAGTELPLLLRDFETPRVPFLDTTHIHVEQIVSRILES